MAYVAIGPTGGHGVAALSLDAHPLGEKGVGGHRPQEQRKAQYHRCQADQVDSQRQRFRPAEAHVERRHDPASHRQNPAAEEGDPPVPGLHTFFQQSLLPLGQQLGVDRDQDQRMGGQKSSQHCQQHPAPDPVQRAGREEEDDAIAHQAQSGLHDPLDDLAAGLGRHFGPSCRVLVHFEPPAPPLRWNPAAVSSAVRSKSRAWRPPPARMTCFRRCRQRQRRYPSSLEDGRSACRQRSRQGQWGRQG